MLRVLARAQLSLVSLPTDLVGMSTNHYEIIALYEPSCECV
jgi:hypothetical protein